MIQMINDKWHKVTLTYNHNDDIVEAAVDGRVVLRKYQRDGVIQIDEVLKAAECDTLVDLTQQVTLDLETLFSLPNRPAGPLPLPIRQRMDHQRTMPAYRQLVRGPKGKAARW